MAYKYWLLALIAGISPTIAAAQDPIRLQGLSDVYFQWKPMPKGSAMCGYAVYGNHTSRNDPKIEWDMNIDEIVTGNERAAAVSAGTFIVHGKTRTPRVPITELSFSVEDDPEPIPAHLVGTPNSDNGVRGILDLERATKLFEAFSYEREIAATLRYADGTSDQLKFSGFRDSRHIGRGKNSPFNECLRGVTPRFEKFGSHPIE
jgi:hypothetical protein